MLLNYRSYMHNIKRFVRAFYGKPVLNYLNILLLYYFSRLTGRVFVADFPFAFSAEASAKCNLGCPECLVGSGKTKRDNLFMDNNVFEKILDETSRKSFYINLYFQGEPFLNRQLFEFISKAKKKKFYTVVSTNGHFLENENSEKIISSGLDKLVVSLDGISAETYRHYRKKGQFNKVITGIRELTRQKKTMNTNHPFIVLQFLVHRKNEHELKHLGSFAKQLGVDSVQIKTMQFINSAAVEDLSPTQEKHRRYKKSANGKWQVKKKQADTCFRLWSQIVITSDGNVVPCCYDKKPDHIAGNINEKSIGDIWKNEGLNGLRKNLLDKKTLPEICNNCYG